MKTDDFHLYFNGVRILKGTFKQIPITYEIPKDSTILALVCPDTGEPGGFDWLVYSYNGELFRSEQPPFLNFRGDEEAWQVREAFSRTNREDTITIHRKHFHNWYAIAKVTLKKYL